MPALGARVSFKLSYRQRGAPIEETAIFGVGSNWTTDFRAYALAVTNAGGTHYYVEHRGGVGYAFYNPAAPHPRYRQKFRNTWNSGQPGYTKDYPDGSTAFYGFAFQHPSETNMLYFLTSHTNPQGHSTTYNYSTSGGILRLTSVTDGDGKTTTLYYTNATFPNLITSVVDPFSRTAHLIYNELGQLTNVVDVAGLPSSFVYYNPGVAPWLPRSYITNMVTPYGTTIFDVSGYDEGFEMAANRAVVVTLPNGGKHLYTLQDDCTGFMAEWNPTVPTTTPYDNTLDIAYLYFRNSFHWGPRQFALQGAVGIDDFNHDDARYRHWSWNFQTLSVERAPRPATGVEGQVTWFDYYGKPTIDLEGTNAIPSITARVLPNGQTWFRRLEFNTNNNISQMVETYTPVGGGGPALRTNTYHHAANAIDVVQIVGPTGHQVVSNYFASGNNSHLPNASYDALNQETKFTYNGNKQLVLRQWPSGLTTSNYYVPSGDGIHRLALTADWEIGRTNTYTYYPNGLVLSHTDERGLSTTNYWEPLQRLTGVLYPDGTTTSNRYTISTAYPGSSGSLTILDLTATKDRLGHWSYAGYDSVRQKVAETNANGVIARYDYCDCGSLMALTNAWNTPQQFVTTFDYDRAGRRIYTYLPDATLTNWFDSLNRVIVTGDAWGYRWLFYNNQGLLTTVSNAFGLESDKVFDIEDHPIYVTDANGVTITNTFDDLGRLRTRTAPDGGTEHFGYSARGLVAYTNQLGYTNFYAYDEAGRRTFETNANWELIRYTNNAAGDLLALVDGKNQVTKWKYDEYGRVTNKLDQAGTEILRYKYDQNHRLTNRWSVAKGNTGYAYDPVGNLTNVNYPASPDISLAYDPLNRLTNMVDAVGTTKYGYAVGGQLWTEDGPWSDDTVTNLYNNRLRVYLSLQQPSGYWANSFGYDTAKRLTNVTSQAGSFGYLLADFVPSTLTIRLDLPNTSYITNTYDANARLLSTTLKNSSSSILNSHSYSYNPGNQRTQQVFNVGSTYNYTYDKIGQLKVADSGTAGEDRDYAYDPAWNLTNRTVNTTPQTFQVDVKNQLTTSTPSGVCTYDDNGNLISSVGGALEYAYDDENQLSIVQTNTVVYSTNYPVWQTLYYYDGLGRLRLRVERDRPVPDPGGGEESLVFGGESLLESGGGIAWYTNSITEYIYDGWRVIQERDGSNVPKVSYTRGTDLSGSLEGAGGIGGLLARSHSYANSNGNWYTHNSYHADGNGNVTYLVSSSQTLAARYRYDPYGNVISSTETLGYLGTPNTYRFSSKMVDLVTGCYYYGYRWYSPNLQRWLNRDPIQELGGLNLYAFINNRPIAAIDPWGEQGTNAPGNGPITFPPIRFPPILPPTNNPSSWNGGWVGNCPGNSFPPYSPSYPGGIISGPIITNPPPTIPTNPPSGPIITNPPSGPIITNPTPRGPIT